VTTVVYAESVQLLVEHPNDARAETATLESGTHADQSAVAALDIRHSRGPGAAHLGVAIAPSDGGTLRVDLEFSAHGEAAVIGFP
jgi:hypothetical protein